MDYDDNDFQNHNLHLAGEANSKFPPVLQSYPLPKFDFDDGNLRFDSLVETQAFLGMEEGDQDSNWIAISRRDNVWSEATSSESVEMLLNSVGEDQVTLREDTIKKSDETMEQLEPGQTNHEDVLVKEETPNVQPNPSLDHSPGEQVLLKDDPLTVAEESSMEENIVVLASDTATVVEADGHDKIGIETSDGLLGQTVAEKLSVEEAGAVLASNTAYAVEDVSSAGDDKIGSETTDSLLVQTFAEKPSMEENNAVIADTATVEAVNSAGHEKIGTETTGSCLDQTVVEDLSMEEKNAGLADTSTVEAVNSADHDKMGTETTDNRLDQTVTEDLSMEEEKIAVLPSKTANVEDVNSAADDKIGTETTDILPDQTEEPSMEESNAVLASDTEAVNSAGHDKMGTETTDNLLDQTVAEELTIEENIGGPASDIAIVEAVNSADHDKIGTETTDSCLKQTVAEDLSMEEKIAGPASDIATVEAVNSAGHGKIETETTDIVPDQTVSEESSMEEKNAVLASDTATVETVNTVGHDKIGNETTDSLLDQTEEAKSVSKMEMDCSVGTVQTGVTGCGELNNQAPLLPETFNDEKDISDQTLSTHGVGGLDVSGTQFQDALVGSDHTPASEHESTIQTETHTQMFLVETSESVDVSQMDSMDESTEVDVSMKGDNNEARARISNLKQNTELTKTVGSETVGSRESASKLIEPKSHSDTIPTDKSGTIIDNKECETFSSQDEAPAVSLTTSKDLHMVNTSSDGNEQVNIFETEKVSYGEPENSQTVQPVNARSFGSHIDQQVRKHTEDTQQATKSVESCPASEESKDAGDADTVGQVLLQQSEETILEENPVTEVVSVPETRSILENDVIKEIGGEAGEGGGKEDNTGASSGMKTAGTPVSHPTGDVIKIGDSCASITSEAFAKSYVTGAEKVAANLGTPVISFPVAKTSELQLKKTKTNSFKKAEDQNISSFMSAESPVLNRNETFSSELNLPSGPRKAGDNSKVVNFSQATLVSPIVVGSPSTSSLEKTAAKSSKTKSERKPRGTPKSAGKETSRKRNSVKGTAPVQHLQSGGRTNAVNQSSASSIQITHSTEKQQSLQTPALNSFGTTLSAPTASLPDLNSSALSSIFRRPFTDLQQVQLRAQIFVYGALIQGSAPDEAYMISAFGGPDGGKDSWEKAWRACAVRAQKMHVSTPGTPLQSRQGKTGTPSVGHTTSKESSAIKPMIPLSSPLWSLSTSLDTFQSSSIQRGSAAAHQSLLSSSHAHQTAPVTNIVGHNTPWMSPLPYRNPWLASPETSGFDGGSRFPVFPIIESAKLTPTKESPLPYSGGKHVHKATPTLEPAGPVAAPAQHTTGTKTRKRKKMPISGESGPSTLNPLNQTELIVSPLVSMSTSVPVTAAPGSLASNAGNLPSVASITAVPMNLVSTFPGKKMKSSLASPIFGGNLVPEVQQRSVLSVDTIDKLNEAKMHAEDASALATAAVSHSEHIWKQIDQQRHAGHQSETQGKLAWAAVAIAAAAAVAKAAAAAANVAANASLQAKLMAEEASLPSISYQGNELPKSNDVTIQGQGTPASILKGEGAVVSSSLVLSAAREAAKKRVEAATAATKRAENMDSIVRAAELASEAVSQAGILVSMGHPPSLEKLVEAGPSDYWRQARESEEAQPCKVGVSEKETMAISDGTFASPRTVPTELDGSVRTADGISGLVSATGKKINRQTDHNGAVLSKNNDVVFEPQVGSKFDTQIESEQIMKTTNDVGIKEGSHVEVFKEGPELRTAWYSANVLRIEDEKAYVLFNDLSIEQGTDKLQEWVALKGDGDEAPKIRTARSVMPYEGTRKRRRAAIGDPVWKIGDRVDSWVHDSWLEGFITEKNKKDENTLTVHFPAQGDTLTIKAWNLRPSLVWKDGRWVECSTSGENISSSHEGDTPKEKRPRLGAPAFVAEVKDTKMKTVDDADLANPPQTGVLDLGVSENKFNIGRSTKEENKPGPPRMKRTGLQTQGAKVIYGVPKPGKKRKFMDVSKHYVSEASTTSREGKEPARPVKPIVPQNPGPGSWRLPSKTVSREKQTMIPKPKTFRPAPKAKEKPVAAARIIPRKDSRNTGSKMESDDVVDKSGESKGTVSETNTKGTGEEQTTSSSQGQGQGQNTSSLGTVSKGRLAKIEEDKSNSSKASHGMEPRRSVRKIQPTSRLLEGLQSSMMASKIPSMSHSRSHQSKK
ncbi:hypothetical protein Bca4012_023775 [Brassica carinata]